MDVKFDHYTWIARVLPVYLTAAPVLLAIAAIVPEGLNIPLAGASAVVFVPLSYFLSQVGADFGARLEPGLWRSWGGPPTTRFLQHDNDEFNRETRVRVHAQLRRLGLNIPTESEEKADRGRAIELYAAAGDELRGRTRDSDRFPLVAKVNAEYGFRRNLLGLKKVGVTIALGSLAISGWALLDRWHSASVLPPVPLGTALLTSGLTIGWLLGVRSEAVRITADRYARALLESAGELEPTS